MERRVEISIGRLKLEGRLSLPRDASGLVVFAHGAGSNRCSSRNRLIAERLQAAGLGTLLFDLVTPEENRIYGEGCDVPLLAERLEIAAFWTLLRSRPRKLALGLFGSGSGAAIALRAAAEMDDAVRAVACRGGRVDLAADMLWKVRAPTLLIVGEEDRAVAGSNKVAMKSLRCPAQLAVVPGATHLFPEPGALEHVASLAADWFVQHLTAARVEPDARWRVQPQRWA